MNDWSDDKNDAFRLHAAASEHTPPDSPQFGLRGTKPHHRKEAHHSSTDYMSLTAGSSRQPARGMADTRPRNNTTDTPQLAASSDPAPSVDNQRNAVGATRIAAGQSLSTFRSQDIAAVADLSHREMPAEPPRREASRTITNASGRLDFWPKYDDGNTGRVSSGAVRQLRKKPSLEADDVDGEVQEIHDDDDEDNPIFDRGQSKFTTTRGRRPLVQPTAVDMLKQKQQQAARMREQDKEKGQGQEDRRELPEKPALGKKLFQPPNKVADPLPLKVSAHSAQKQKSKEPETIDLLDSDEDAPLAGHAAASMISGLGATSSWSDRYSATTNKPLLAPSIPAASDDTQRKGIGATRVVPGQSLSACKAIASEINTSNERAEKDTANLELVSKSDVPLDGASFELLRQLREHIVKRALGNGAVPPPSIENHHGEASQSIEFFVSQLDLIKTMVRGIKSQSNDSSSTADRPFYKRGGDSATEDIEDVESDSSYRESLDDGRPSKGRKRKEASRAQSSASKKARKESPEDSHDKLVATPHSGLIGTVMSIFNGFVTYATGSSAKKAAPIVTATAPHHEIDDEAEP